MSGLMTETITLINQSCCNIIVMSECMDYLATDSCYVKVTGYGAKLTSFSFTRAKAFLKSNKDQSLFRTSYPTCSEFYRTEVSHCYCLF